MSHTTRIAIIGAGITGLHLARRLSAKADIEVFEKSRGLGGRMSTRRTDDYQFDHGAQYFTSHSEAFRRFLQPFIQAGVVAPWAPRLAALGHSKDAPVWTAPRYVALPGMNGLCKEMAEGINIRRNTRVGTIERLGTSGWALTSSTDEDLGHFDWVVSTAPAEQSAKLMPACFSHLDALCAARMLGCYSLMLGGLDLSGLAWDAATVSGSPVSWIAVNCSKPGRGEGSAMLCQSDNEWAETHLEHNPDDVQEILLEAVCDLTGVSAREADYMSLHKWRFAKVAKPVDLTCLLDVDHRLAAAGDWCGAGKVEAGFESAENLANRLEEHL